MDLGIAGKTALVCGASAGLGRGCALALAADGVRVTIVARNAARLAETARALSEATATKVAFVAADVTTAEGQAQALAAAPDPDILVNNAGGPPPGRFRDWDRETWIKALESNMLSAIFMTQAVIDPMMARGFGRIVNITSMMVKMPAGVLGLSNGARSGLTGFMGGLAREVAGSGVTVNNLLPGQFDTDRLRSNQQRAAEVSGQPLEAVRESALRSIPAGRFGQADEFGALCAFVCSVRAGFITGQNLLLDGGQYPGLL
jgi:3-oxoacyl-[acyl-carrier protein] reductase